MMDQYRDNITHKKNDSCIQSSSFSVLLFIDQTQNEIGRNVCSILSLSKYVVGSDILPRMCMW